MAITTTTATTGINGMKTEPASPGAASAPALSIPSPTPDAKAPTSPASASPSTSTAQAQAQGTTQPKRRAPRRANTAERRATHNAVERMRRETLNGRFLLLASMLPPLAALRRPSKSAIVGSSIATVHASRRHRVLAAQTLRAMAREAENLRREVNEWRARARVPQLDAPKRSEAYATVLRAEVEDFDLTLEEGFELEEEGEEEEREREDDVEESRPATMQARTTRERSASVASMSTSAPPSAHPGFFYPQAVQAQQAQMMIQRQQQLAQQQLQQHVAGASTSTSTSRFAYDVPSSPASSDSGSGPSTPPSSAGAHIPVPLPMSLDGMDPMQMQLQYEALQMHQAQQALMMKAGYAQMPPPTPVSPYEAQSPYGAFDGVGEEGLLLGGVPAMIGMGMKYPGDAGMGISATAGLGMGMGWARGNPAHPAFHQQQQAYEGQAQQARMMQMQQQQQQQQQMAMGAGVGGLFDRVQGVQPGQYLHQPGRFA